MKSAICEFAFGTRSLTLNPESLFRGAPAWQTDPNEVKLTACSDSIGGRQIDLLPFRLIVSEGKEFFPFLQAERAPKYQLAISATISSLGLYFDQLNASSPLVQILTQSAVSPTELQQMARGAFDKERSAVGLRAEALLGAASSGALFEISLGPALANMYGGVSVPITKSSSLFSSPLPFGRADFGPKTFDGLYQVNLGLPENWLYLIRTRTGPQSVAAAGMASLRIGLSNTLALPTYPISQISRDLSEYIAGSDFLTVLDACANGDPMRVELHSLFPTRVDVNFLSEEKCCGKYAKKNITGDNEPPPILTVPVTCPASLVELGEKRRRSKLGRPVYESHLRVSVASLAEKLSPSEKAILVAYGARRGVTPTAAEAPVLEKMRYLFAAAQNVSEGKGTDVQERAAVLGSLLIDPDSVIVTVDSLRYYAHCAPPLCTWIETSYRTFGQALYAALDMLGGTSGAIMGFLFVLYMLMFLCARACVRQQRAQKGGARVGAEGSGKEAEGLDVGGEKKGAVQLSKEMLALHAELAKMRGELRELRGAAGGGAAAAQPAGEGGGGGASHGLQLLEAPAAPLAQPSPRARSERGGAAPAAREPLPRAALPSAAPWRQLMDGSSGRPYWHNSDTGETTWEEPLPRPQSLPQPLAAAPSSWEALLDGASGRSYFHNRLTGETRWEAP